MNELANTDKENIERFVAYTEAYCALIENPIESKIQLAYQLTGQLSGLYLSVLYLPNFDGSNSQIEYDLETIPDIVKADKKIEAVLDRIFGKHNACRRFWNVYKDDELDVYTIADDLINIYHDLKTGLLEFRKQSDQSHLKATKHWKTFFAMHWGYHLVGVMQPLHRIVYSALDGSDDEEE